MRSGWSCYIVKFQIATAPQRIRLRAKATWARLVRKVHESDPLVCPKCDGPMRVIGVIDDPAGRVAPTFRVIFTKPAVMNTLKPG